MTTDTRTEAAPAIEIEYLYSDPNQAGDLTTEPCGPLAYVTYQLGSGKTLVEYSIKVDGSVPPYMTMLPDGRTEIWPDTAEQIARNVLTLLADPRVRAAREAQQ